MPRAKKNDRRKVAIISRESDEKTLDIAMLEAELQKRGISVKVLSKLLTKDKSLGNALGYSSQLLKQELAILGADVVVLDTYCIPASILPHRKSTKIVQIWHSLCAIKKFGWQTVGKEDGTSEKTARIMRMHRGYDYVTAPSDITAEHYCAAFDVDRNQIVKLGLPRIDYIKSITAGEKKAEVSERIFEKYPSVKKDKADGKRIILYAPTFRRGSSPDVEGLIKAIDSEQNTVVVKLHPLYREGGSKLKTDRVIQDECFDSIDWLSVADAVISDYSSLVVEAGIADKPLYLYTYDIEEYGRSTGLNINLEQESIGCYAFRSSSDLASALEKPYDTDALRSFRDKYVEIDTSKKSCTEQMADFIESIAGGKKL